MESTHLSIYTPNKSWTRGRQTHQKGGALHNTAWVFSTDQFLGKALLTIRAHTRPGHGTYKANTTLHIYGLTLGQATGRIVFLALCFCAHPPW